MNIASIYGLTKPIKHVFNLAHKKRCKNILYTEDVATVRRVSRESVCVEMYILNQETINEKRAGVVFLISK